MAFEIRTLTAAASAALMGLGIGLVILAQPVLFEGTNESLADLGWSLVGLGGLGLVISLASAIRSATNRPRIVIGCGSSELFQRQEKARERHWKLGIGIEPTTIYITRIEVRETNDVNAPDVRIQVIESDPPFPPEAAESLPVVLEWSSRQTSHHLTPRGRSHVHLCELVTYADNPDLDWVYGHISDRVLASGKKVRLNLQPVIDGQRPSKKSIESILVDWTSGQAHPIVTAMP